jgi:hypothetical protein
LTHLTDKKNQGFEFAMKNVTFKNFFTEAEIKKFSMTSGTEEVQKGEATKQQLGMQYRYM